MAIEPYDLWTCERRLGSASSSGAIVLYPSGPFHDGSSGTCFRLKVCTPRIQVSLKVPSKIDSLSKVLLKI